MEDDDGDWAGRASVLIPLSLIHALSFALLKTLDDWMDEHGIEEIQVGGSFAAMAAAVNAAMESLTSDDEGMTLQ